MHPPLKNSCYNHPPNHKCRISGIHQFVYESKYGTPIPNSLKLYVLKLPPILRPHTPIYL